MSRFAVFYSIITALHIAASSFEIAYVPYFTKPVLMLFLALFFYRNAPKPLSRLSKVTLYALFFSWLGDVLLMFQGFQAIYFLLGLVSFLLAHLCYIFALRQSRSLGTKTPKSQKSSSKIVMGASLFYILIGIGSIALLKDGLGSMFIPVVVYAATIIGMNLAAVRPLRKSFFDQFLVGHVGGSFFFDFGLAVGNQQISYSNSCAKLVGDVDLLFGAILDSGWNFAATVESKHSKAQNV